MNRPMRCQEQNDAVRGTCWRMAPELMLFGIVLLAPLALCCQGSASPGGNSDSAVAGQAAVAPAIDLSRLEFVDLTHTYDDQTLYWPTATERFDLDRQSFGETDGGYFYAANAFSTPEHGGTHLDAPIHFAAGGQTLDQVPLERLIAPAAVIDVSEQAAANHDYQLTREDVVAWETEHGRLAPGTAVLLRTGWAQRWPDALAYLGDATVGDASRLHFPSFGVDSARLLVEERQVALLGVDTASIDSGPSTDFMVHRIANGANVPGLENVADLSRLPATGSWILALPIKIGGGSGGPVRVVALVPREPREPLP